MKSYEYRVIMPADWEQISRSPTQYRRKVENSGVLTISLVPLCGDEPGDADALHDRLQILLTQAATDPGEERARGAFEVESGTMVYSIRVSREVGGLCFWLGQLTAEMCVFAVFEM